MNNVFNPDQYLAYMYQQLLSTEIKKIVPTREWANEYPNEPGVYLIRDKDEIIYVGETGSIRGRMKAIIDTRNHVIRRTLGKKLFFTLKGTHPQRPA